MLAQEDSHERDGSDPNARHAGKKKKKFMNMYINNKSKLMASVYNVYRRYPTSPPSFSSSPIYLLGHCYQCDPAISQFHYIDNSTSNTTPSPSSNDTGIFTSFMSKNNSNNNNNNNNNSNGSPHIATFLKDFESLLWFSYRKDFPPIGPAQITSDIGWGCMLRTGQMMLAQAFIAHFLGREWRLGTQDVKPLSAYRQILRLFADAPGPASPFSLHNIVLKNKAMTPTLVDETKYKGEVWFAPSVIAKVLRVLVHNFAPDSFTMYVPTDGVVYMDKVAAACTQPHQQQQQHGVSQHANRVDIQREGAVGVDEGWRSVLLMIPLRLGIDKLNPTYFRAIFECLRMPQSVGIIGGKPKQSFYFVGYQDEYLVYLDPHIVHESVRPDKEFSNSTYHCRVPQKIHISQVDPSLAMGFYCHTRTEFEQLCEAATWFGREMDFVFSVAEKQPVYSSEEDNDDDDDAPVIVQ